MAHLPFVPLADDALIIGIVSALSFVPDYSGTYAAGTYAGTVTLYSEDTGGTPVQHVGGIKGGGVTQVSEASTLILICHHRG